MDTDRITALPLFADVPAEDLTALAEAATERLATAGDLLVQEGDFGYTVFLIEQGTAEVVKNGTVVVTLGPGDVFGEIAVHQSGRRTADVRATSDMRLITVLNRDLWKVERRLPEIGTRLRATAKARALQNKVVGQAELEAH